MLEYKPKARGHRYFTVVFLILLISSLVPMAYAENGTSQGLSDAGKVGATVDQLDSINNLINVLFRVPPERCWPIPKGETGKCNGKLV